MIKGFSAILCFAMAFWAPLPSLAAVDDLQASVVKIQTGFRTPDQYQPWDMGYQNTKYGSGFIVKGNRIMTNAHVVGDQVYIQVQKAGDTRKYTAKVEYVAHDCEIALLRVEDESFFEGTRPVKFGGVPMQRDRVAAYGFPTGGEVLSITEGIVSRVEVQFYSHSQRELLAIQIDAAINPGNSGGPVFKGGEVVGISFQTYGGSQTQNIGYIVPVPVINRFYDDIRDGKYDGYPTLGFFWEKMENPALRESCHLQPRQGGILVTKVLYNSPCWQVLQEGDVITSLAGVPVQQDGTVAFRGNERVRFIWLLNRFQVGDAADIGIIRGGKPLAVRVKLGPTRTLVPLMTYETRPTYLLYGGLVFMPLNYNYLSTRNWNDVDSKFRELFVSGLITGEKRQVIFINQVLPHDINIGYQDISRAVVEKVNGRLIGEMKDLIEAFKHPVGDFHVIELEDYDSCGTRLVLDARRIDKANTEIMKTYSVSNDRSEDLRE